MNFILKALLRDRNKNKLFINIKNDFKFEKSFIILKSFYCINEDSSKKEILSKKYEKIKLKKNLILNDIKQTKNLVKEKVEKVIERENVYTIPNLLCVARIVLSPYLGVLIMQENFHTAFGLLVFVGITDLMDGWIARTWLSQSSKLGSFLDPMADKILVATLFLTLTYSNLIPVPLTLLIISRDILLISAALIIRYKSLPVPRTLSKYMDVSLATVQLAPTLISKINTCIQLTLVGTTLAAPVFDFVDHPYLHALWYTTGATTIAATISYLVEKNTFKIFKN